LINQYKVNYEEGAELNQQQGYRLPWTRAREPGQKYNKPN